MRTLIRASQLHPDISGLVKAYGDQLYPNYNNLSGASGIKSIAVGNTLYFTLNNENGAFVQSVVGLSGSIDLTGISGIFTQVSGKTIYIGYSGGGGGLFGFSNISGYGNVDVWPINPTTLAISGISITGGNGIETIYNSNKSLLTIRSSGIGRLNNRSGDVSLVGRNGAQITVTGQTIFIDASQAAFSGVNSINGLQGAPLSTIGTADININTVTGLNSIFIGYTGRGWGSDHLFNGDNFDVNYIGNENIFLNNQSSFIDGDGNILQQNTGIVTLNSQESNYSQNNNSTFINVTGSTFSNITGSIFINGILNSQKFRHPYAVGFGGSVDNTFSTNLYMKSFLSGKQIMKTLKVPKTSYSGIYIQTGSILFGEINYVAVRYDVTDFDASFDAKNFGIYGKKYFMAQRATNLQIDVKDESDLFGGTNKYNLFISGGNDERLYLWGSGYSGSDPGDGLDGVHDVIFIANVNFVNFNISPYID